MGSEVVFAENNARGWALKRRPKAQYEYRPDGPSACRADQIALFFAAASLPWALAGHFSSQ